MTRPQKHPLRALLVNALLIAAGFALLGLAIWNNRGQIRDVFGHEVDGRMFALAFVLYLAAMVLTFVRWFWLVRVVEPSFRLGPALLLGSIASLFNLVIPGAVGGDLIKAAYLVKTNVKKTQAIASMVIDRILGLLGLFILAGVAGAFAWPLAGRGVRRLIAVTWAAVVLGFLGLTVVFTRSLTRHFPRFLAGQGRLATIFRELDGMSATYRQRLGVVARSLVLSTFTQATNVLAFYLVSRTLFPARFPSLGQHFLMVPPILVSTAIPMPFGALGLTEQISDQLFKLVAHPGGALAMMGFRVLVYGGGLVCAGVYLANLRQVRSLVVTAEHLDELREGEVDRPRDAVGRVVLANDGRVRAGTQP